MILDLIQYRVQKEGWPEIPEYATLQANGGAAAAQILKMPQVANWTLCSLLEDGSEFQVKHLVKEIFVAMELRCAADESFAPATLKLRRERLFGWDLLELAHPPSQSFRREVVIHETTSSVVPQYPSWLPLTKRVPVYLCDNLGDIITSRTPVCCRKVWRGKKYLVASLHTLRQLFQMKPHCTDLHLDCDLVWERQMLDQTIFRSCHHQKHNDDHEARENFDSKVQTLLRGHECKDQAVMHSICNDGAVVFGPSDNFLVRFNAYADRFAPVANCQSTFDRARRS